MVIDILRKNIYIFLLFLLFFLFYDSLSFSLPFLIEESEINLKWFGFTLTIGTMLRSLISIYLSNKNEQFKFKFLVSAIFIVLLLFYNFNYLGLIWKILSLSLAIALATMFNILLNPFMVTFNESKKLGLLFGIRDTFLYLGSGLGLLIIGRYFSNNYTLVLKFNSFILLIILFFLFFIFSKSKNELKEDEISKSKKEDFKYKDLLHETNLLKYLIFLSFFTISGVGGIFLPVFGNRIGINKSLLAYIFSGSIFISSFFSLAGGYLIEKLCRKKLYLIYIFSYITIYIAIITKVELFYYISLCFFTLNLIIANVLPSYFFETFDSKYWGVVSTISLITGSLTTILVGVFIEDKLEVMSLVLLIVTIFTFLLGNSILISKKTKLQEI